MAEPIFNAGISGQNVVAAPYAAHGGTNNFYFANGGPDRPRKPFSNVPFPPDPDFVDRPRITAWLRDKCNQPAGRAALVGLGGIGKSQLAVNYAHEVRQGSPDTYVFWVHAGTRERFEEAYSAIANRLQLPRHSDPDVDVVRLVYDWLCAEENGHWLMVVDNADDVKVFYPKPIAEQSGFVASKSHRPLASFLPQSSNGKILVTSRRKDVAERLTGSSRNVLSIEAMDENQAHQLLRNKLQGAHDEEVASELLQALEYMPLAITQAAAYILRQAPRASPSTYLADFRISEKKASLLNRNMGDLRRDPSASNSIVTTWQITFDSIRQERQSAADLLAFLSFFNPQGIPEWILRSYHLSKGDETETIIEVDEFEDDISMLLEFSLVTITTQKDVLEMHPLVQFCTQIWLSATENVRTWRRTFLHVLSREYPPGAFEDWARCQELDPHTQSLVNNKPEHEDDLKDFSHLLLRMAYHKRNLGKYEEAEQLSRQALEVCEKVLGEKNYKFRALNDIALFMLLQGKHKEAGQMYRRALERFEKSFGAEHVETLNSLDGLSAVLREQGKYKEAELMNRQALEAREKVQGREHHHTLISHHNLATVLRFQGKYKDAEQMYLQVLEASEKALGKEHPTTLVTISGLAAALLAQGKYNEAEQLFKQAIEGEEKVFGTGHPRTLAVIHWLGLVLGLQGMHNEAEQLFQQALEGKEKVLGIMHPSTHDIARRPALVGYPSLLYTHARTCF
ncbi:TPR-like protein [Colletotrichum sublineola]|nr:TPR-like protein [Colletotrichum sublineola]